jgi:uncharacterized protein (DUF1697 family)
MADHAAFLKGINLGRRRITNEELRGHFEAIGLLEPAVFRASGNVVFSCPEARGEAELVALIEAELGRLLGYEVATFLRDRKQMLEIAAAQPFDARTSGSLKGKLQVALLGKRPSAAVRARALELAGREDALAFGSRELYWLPVGPMSGSSLDLKALGRLLGPMTIRTKGTVEQIAARHFAA